MKRLKYMYSLQRSKKQKSREKEQLQNQNPKSQYLKTLKTQAIKTLYNFEQNCLTKTQLNITSRNTQPLFSNQYKSRSLEQKDNFRKTMTSKFTQLKTIDNKRKLSMLESSNMNIRTLLRAKTESQGSQNNKLLRNPFYKIQKLRQQQKRIIFVEQQVDVDQQDQPLVEQTKYNNSQHLKNQQQISDNFFISRNKKQWYFASKKFRLRTVQQDQPHSGVQTTERNTTKPTNAKTPQTNKTSIKSHSHKGSTLSEYESAQVLQFNRFDSIMNDADNIIVEQSREESPARIRDKSLTVKYNEIKDYFEKKYQYKNQQCEDYLQVDNFDHS